MRQQKIQRERPNIIESLDPAVLDADMIVDFPVTGSHFFYFGLKLVWAGVASNITESILTARINITEIALINDCFMQNKDFIRYTLIIYEVDIDSPDPCINICLLHFPDFQILK